MDMQARHDRNRGFGFTFSEAASHPSQSIPKAEQNGGKTGPLRKGKPSKPLTTSHRDWCATHAASRNIPQPRIEEALVLLNHDRLLVENVLNTAEQTGFAPMTIVESILERRG